MKLVLPITKKMKIYSLGTLISFIFYSDLQNRTDNYDGEDEALEDNDLDVDQESQKPSSEGEGDDLMENME
jgi:hypothetical protein